MDEVIHVQVAGEVIGTVDVLLGTAIIGFSAKHWHDEPHFAAINSIGFGAIDAAAVASLFMTRDTRSHVLGSIVHATPVVISLSLTAAHDPAPFPRLTVASLTAGYGVAGAIGIVNEFAASTPYSTLRADRERLERGASLDPDEREAMQRHLLGSRGPIPRWIAGLALVSGGAVAITPAFNDATPSKQKTVAAIFGSMGMLGGLLSFLPGPVDRYEDDLKTLDVALTAAPGSVTLQGTFMALRTVRSPKVTTSKLGGQRSFEVDIRTRRKYQDSSVFVGGS